MKKRLLAEERVFHTSCSSSHVMVKLKSSSRSTRLLDHHTKRFISTCKVRIGPRIRVRVRLKACGLLSTPSASDDLLEAQPSATLVDSMYLSMQHLSKLTYFHTKERICL